ncbi:MAG: type II toxin-antitoxin system PemK/MazF family toxin [Alkalinema sp. RU_4_3]|nr:type II toxin-antitoxin system PemK/MazF family toxin [Alkalinema sp. RU_4_3]
MPSQTPNQGEIILIPVPFTDLSSQKRRPVIIASNNLYNQSSRDMLVVAMTSNLSAIPYSFIIDNPDLALGTLNRPSLVRCDKIYTLDQGLIVKRFGQVKPEVLDQIYSLLQQILLPTP